MLSKNEINYIRLLKDKKHRDTEKRFLIEGTKWVLELVQKKPDWIDTIYTTAGWLNEHVLPGQSDKIKKVESFELEKLSLLSEPAPVLAVVKKPETKKLPFNENQWNLVLDGIQDPGNIGTIIRIADWFGLKSIWCSTDCADAFNPKVVQATMGSLCRVNVVYTSLNELLSATNLPIYVTGTKGQDIFGIHSNQGVLIIGSEGKGVKKELAEKANYTLTIPRIGEAESLNAAVAAGILVANLTSGIPKSRGH